MLEVYHDGENMLWNTILEWKSDVTNREMPDTATVKPHWFVSSSNFVMNNTVEFYVVQA